VNSVAPALKPPAPDGPTTFPASPPQPVLARLKLLRPVDAKWSVSTGGNFGAKAACWGPRGHLGTDFACPEGTPVRAVDDGEVTADDFDARSGFYVLVKHVWGTSRYCHFGPRGPHLGGPTCTDAPMPVRAGEIIGYSGSSGSRLDGKPMPPHLHAGVCLHSGDWFDMEPCFAVGPAPDVGPNDPGVEAIARCLKEGVLLGDGDGNFRPDDRVTRHELAWFACQLMDWIERDWAQRGVRFAEAVQPATGGDA